ncbi:glcNAc-PI de-N-acetylase domain-containing protein [Ditylenchus destructor]|uniref:N-acetylglucosaminylphosphatidylinositol deacetylase n=1 Tax=Ditylenchus destructor TaxID=166010 RepID=A0AAD4N486_9BILA|nr:glcNAc-PI de-N-acetylase domain-containing protein [Ditylenchus destructor]
MISFTNSFPILEFAFYLFVIVWLLAIFGFTIHFFLEHRYQLSIPCATEPSPCRYLLLIAHPDDESMFFGPTIQCLTSSKRAELFVLCITSGNSAGLGQIRKKELEKAIASFGISSSHLDFLGLDDDEFADGFHEKWDIERLSLLVSSHVRQLKCHYIVTFDGRGVSGHPNHIECFRAAQLIMRRQLQSGVKDLHYPQIIVLESVSIIRKYISWLDLILTYLFTWISCSVLHKNDSQTKFICVANPLRVFQAMRQHKSQLVWFRYLYLLFSRYVTVNSLKLLTR